MGTSPVGAGTSPSSRASSVIAYDFRGNGNSDEPSGPVTMATFVDDTLALLDALSVDRAHVYGQSFGGMVAQELAIARPERVRTLILGCTHVGPRHVCGEALPACRRAVALDVRARLPGPPPRARGRGPPRGCRPAETSGGRAETMGGDAGFDSFDRLPNLELPTLVVHGSEDRRSHRRTGSSWRGGSPGAELLLLEGAGHLYHSEQAGRADAAVLDFIRRHGDA